MTDAGAWPPRHPSGAESYVAGDFYVAGTVAEDPFVTRAVLRADQEGLGLRPGDAVLVHGALRRVGRLRGGPDALIAGLLDAVAPGGTALGYTDWDARYAELLDEHGR